MQSNYKPIECTTEIKQNKWMINTCNSLIVSPSHSGFWQRPSALIITIRSPWLYFKNDHHHTTSFNLLSFKNYIKMFHVLIQDTRRSTFADLEHCALWVTDSLRKLWPLHCADIKAEVTSGTGEMSGHSSHAPFYWITVHIYVLLLMEQGLLCILPPKLSFHAPLSPPPLQG